MNTIVTSAESILEVSRKLAIESGLESINIRSIAASCGVSVGSVYNYFPSKADLICATVERVWKEIFHNASQARPPMAFTACVIWLFRTIQKGSLTYPSFFTLHSMSFAVDDREKGRTMMAHYFTHMKNALLQSLSTDPAIPKDIFNEVLTKTAFVEFVFSNIISLSMQKAQACDTLIEIINRTLSIEGSGT